MGIQPLRMSLGLGVLAASLTLVAPVHAVGFDADDFLVASAQSYAIDVFDHDFTYKGRLYEGPIYHGIGGLDFDSHGNVVALGGAPMAFPRITPDGSTTYIEVGEFGVGDLKVGPDGNYYVPAPGESGVRVYASDGDLVRTIGSGAVSGIAILPNHVLWAGRDAIETFDLTNGAPLGTLPLPAGQREIGGMFYSAETQTVLMTDPQYADPNNADAASATAAVYELDLAGQVVRVFHTLPYELGQFNQIESYGVTRGPNGDVFATDQNGMMGGRIAHWKADGTYLGLQFKGGDGLTGIVWAGNTTIPEPASVMLLGSAMCVGVAIFRRRERGN